MIKYILLAILALSLIGCGNPQYIRLPLKVTQKTLDVDGRCYLRVASEDFVYHEYTTYSTEMCAYEIGQVIK